MRYIKTTKMRVQKQDKETTEHVLILDMPIVADNYLILRTKEAIELEVYIKKLRPKANATIMPFLKQLIYLNGIFANGNNKRPRLTNVSGS